MSFTLRDIDYFLAVAKGGRLAQAAQAYNVTQSAVTKAIKRLESEFGLQLFERNARGTRITAAGLKFMQVAQGLSAGYADAVRVVSEMRTQDAGLLRIGFSDLTRANLVLPSMAALVRQRPGLRVKLRIGQSDTLLIQAVRDGDLDLAVVPIHQEMPGGCEGIEIGEDIFRPVVRDGHPLARLPKLSLADLQPYAWILAAPGSLLHRGLAAAYAHRGLLPPEVAVEIDHASAFTLSMARTTDLLMLAPESLMRESGPQGLHTLPFPELEMRSKIMLLTRSDATGSRLLETFKASLAGEAGTPA